MNHPVQSWDFVLFYLIIGKLDDDTREVFENFSLTEEPTFDQLLAFLNRRVKSLLVSNDVRYKNKPRPTNKSRFESAGPERSNSRGVFVATSGSPSPRCAECSSSHVITDCKTFLARSPKDRYRVAKRARLCIQCLESNHSSSSCTNSSKCKVCQGSHHYLLHFTSGAESKSSKVEPNVSSPVDVALSQTCALSKKEMSHDSTFVLLSTALISVKTRTGGQVVARALIDPGSQYSLVTTDFVNRCDLQADQAHQSVRGIGGDLVPIKNSVRLEISPTASDRPHYSVDALCVPKISGNIPSIKLPISLWEHIIDLRLADSSFAIPQAVDILLGADIFPKLLKAGRREGPAGSPVALESTFGWILLGPTSQNFQAPCPQCNSVSVFHIGLEEMVSSFWELENYPVKTFRRQEDDSSENLYASKQHRQSDGRYVVPILFKPGEPVLGSSEVRATKRLKALEYRFGREPELQAHYSDFMQKLIDNNIMVEMSREESESSEGYYLPHHAVWKKNGSEQSIRVVFDASARSENGKSLNDCVFPGPKLQNDIVNVLIGFRMFPVALTGDIKQMFLQIRLAPSDCNYQRILWRFRPEDDVTTYKLLTVTFGVSSSPFLAIRTLLQLINDEGEEFKLAAKALSHQIFVDDLLTSCPSVDMANRLRIELTELFARGGFTMRKWASNRPEVLQDVPVEDLRSIENLSFETDCNFLKILGLDWNPAQDYFTYKFSSSNGKATKRQILSQLARIYDPMGWLAPIIVRGKLLMKELWSLKLQWDDPVPLEIATQWQHFQEELVHCSRIKVPRPVQQIGQKPVFHLHGFSDSSERAYACAVYLVTIDKVGKSSSTIVIAKTRLSPSNRKITLARLELCGAALLVRVLHTIIPILKSHIEIEKIFCWTDSSIVLHWICSPPERWQTFVAHRVDYIQQHTDSSWWRHIASENNPADSASRGIMPNELVDHTLWWQAPAFVVSTEDTWPPPKISLPSIDPSSLEEKPKKVLKVEVVDTYVTKVLNSFSSLLKLQRATAYCLRWRNLSSLQRTFDSPLTTEELKKALIVWVRIVQLSSFHDDIERIKRGSLPSSRLSKLSPFLDVDGLLRAGGRLAQSDLPAESRHPILLPGKAHLSTLIIDFYHHQFGHPGPSSLLALVRKRFWILGARREIRTVVFRCMACCRVKKKSFQPVMAPLPRVRVEQPLRAFINSGVDYAGPILIKSSTLRKAPQMKAYICIFICLSTKACHIEVVSRLSTDAFLAALNRFVSRRGLCLNIYSDNGTNFVGADRELKKFLVDRTTQHTISDASSIIGIQWHFSPPSAPHFGGIWEAAVKSAKQCLYKITQGSLLTFEELYTIMTKVEACLNSRPLVSVSEDPTEFDVLTPGHFLIQDSLQAVPEQDRTSSNYDLRNRWHLVSRLAQTFWKRWKDEYLRSLQARSKWTKPAINLKPGMMVLLKDDDLPPLAWKIGRIVDVFPGRDGHVRVATVKTSSSQYKRPANKLIPLPFEQSC